MKTLSVMSLLLLFLPLATAQVPQDVEVNLSNPIINGRNVEIGWSSLNYDINNYWLIAQLADNSSFLNPTEFRLDDFSPIEFNNLEDGNWYVRARVFASIQSNPNDPNSPFNDTLLAVSNSIFFQISEDDLPTPSYSIIDQAPLNSKFIELLWVPIAGVRNYEVQFSTRSDFFPFSTLEFRPASNESRRIFDLSLLSQMTGSGTLYVRFRGIFPNGETEWSRQSISFNILDLIEYSLAHVPIGESWQSQVFIRAPNSGPIPNIKVVYLQGSQFGSPQQVEVEVTDVFPGNIKIVNLDNFRGTPIKFLSDQPISVAVHYTDSFGNVGVFQLQRFEGSDEAYLSGMVFDSTSLSAFVLANHNVLDGTVTVVLEIYSEDGDFITSVVDALPIKAGQEVVTTLDDFVDIELADGVRYFVEASFKSSQRELSVLGAVFNFVEIPEVIETTLRLDEDGLFVLDEETMLPILDSEVVAPAKTYAFPNYIPASQGTIN